MSKNLIVDLDHSLIKIDLLQLSSKRALLKNPLLIFIMPFWLMRGKGFLKDKLVQRVQIDSEKLPYNNQVIAYIRERQQQGDKIILATASHYIYAEGWQNI
jgi:phosphoserine phosphatase